MGIDIEGCPQEEDVAYEEETSADGWKGDGGCDCTE
jgi:hypothetical protein